MCRSSIWKRRRKRNSHMRSWAAAWNSEDAIAPSRVLQVRDRGSSLRAGSASETMAHTVSTTCNNEDLHVLSLVSAVLRAIRICVSCGGRRSGGGSGVHEDPSASIRDTGFHTRVRADRSRPRVRGCFCGGGASSRRVCDDHGSQPLSQGSAGPCCVSRGRPRGGPPDGPFPLE